MQLVSDHFNVRESSEKILQEYKHYKQYFAARAHNRVGKRRPTIPNVGNTTVRTMGLAK